MKKQLNIIVIVLFFTIVLILSSVSLSDATGHSEYHVLILNSYHKGFQWTDNIVKGITEFFDKRGVDTMIHIEYMDSKVTGYGAEYKKKLHDLYKYKYSVPRHSHDIDVIISSDDNALDFLREYHKELFPGVPIVFSGVNNFEIAEIVDRKYFTGIFEVAGLDESIDLIFKLHPDTTTIFLIVDDTPSGEYRWSQMQSYFRTHPEIEFARIGSDKTMGEIEDVLGKLEVGTIVVFMTMYRDSTGQFIPLEEGVNRLSDASAQPIYTFHAQVFRHGTIGGKLLGGYHHGEEAAKLAIRILNGEPPSTIPFIDYSITEYMFDYGELKRYDIDMDTLPIDSIVVNFPISYYNEHKVVVWTIFLVMATLAILTSYLSISIIKRRKTELSLEEALSDIRYKKREYEALIHNIPGMIYRGGSDWGATIISGAKLISGYTEKEINEKEKNWLSIIHPDDVEQVVKESLPSSDDSLTQEYRIIKKDGSICWVEDRKELLQSGDDSEKIDGIVFDITDRIGAMDILAKLEVEQRQTSKLEAIGNFAQGIAHDFNNALTPVIGGCEILLYKMPEEHKEYCEQQLKNILSAATTASSLVHRIQAFTRKDGGEILMPLKLFNCVKESFQFLRSMTPTSIEMNMHVDKDVNFVMATDITIRQILMNLVKNSIQAMPLEEGIIDINVSNDIILIERFGLSKGNYVKIEVEDNGNGMSPEILERAIDPYFTTKKEGIGSGIGLSVVSSIVQGYNGFVRLYSEEGKGTKVVIYLPSVVEEKDMRFDECRLDDISNGNGEKILLVDDEKIVIDVVVSVLKSLNYKVEFFLNSSEAFKEFVKRPDDFDVVITDLTMPEMTGVTLINEIRGLRPEQKIILCSGLGSNGNIKEKIPGKVVAYLTKPVSRSDYAKVLSRILNEDI